MDTYCCSWLNAMRDPWLLRSFFLLAAAAMGVMAATACVGMEKPTPMVMKTPTPDPTNTVNTEIGSPTYLAGLDLFNRNCAQCHGEKATGSDAGPPLIHEVYQPYHHPDFSFHAAVNKGVPAHHWFYGDMPPIPGLSHEDVEKIICYVRQLQDDSGMPAGNAC